MNDPRFDDLLLAAPGLRLETAPAELEHYGRDWTRRWTPAPMAIAFPASVGEVQALVRWATATPWRSFRLAGVPASRVVRWQPTVSWW